MSFQLYVSNVMKESVIHTKLERVALVSFELISC